MAFGDLIVQEYQYEYNDLLLGVDTPYHMQEISGLGGYNALRSGTTDRMGRHGATPGKQFAPHREFYIKFDLNSVDATAFGLERFIAMNAFKPRSQPDDEIPFVFWHPGSIVGKTFIYCRPVDFNLQHDRDFALMHPMFNVRFEASDPTIKSITEFSTTLTLDPDPDGVTFPLSFPLNFGPSQNNDLVYTIFGTASSHWHVSLTGQITGPRIEQVSTGKVLNLPSLEVETGHTLEIDSRTRTILLDGTGNRRGDLTAASKWFTLDPGAINDAIRYSANGPTSGSQITLTYRWEYWGEW
jgi:hypothetical protein